MSPAEHAALWRAAALPIAAVVAFAAAAYALRPRGSPLKSYLLAAAAVFWVDTAANLAPLACAALGRDPDAARPVTFAGYAAAFVIAVAALRRGQGRAVLAAAAAIVIRWILYAVCCRCILT